MTKSFSIFFYTSKMQEMQNDESVEKLNKLLDEKFTEASGHRKTFESDWCEYERFYDGKQWPTGETKPIENVIFQLIESEAPILSDSMPGSDILPRNDEHQEEADQLKAHLDYTYEYNSLHLKLTQVIRKALISGNPFFYVSYSPDEDGGQGMALIKTLGWRMVFLDPLANNLDEISYAIIKIPMRIAELKRMFPKYAEQIKGGRISLDMSGASNDSVSESKHVYKSDGDNKEKYNIQDGAFLEEYWLKDYTMIPITEEETAEEISFEEMQIAQGQLPELSKYEDHQLHSTQHLYDLTDMIAKTVGMAQGAVTPEVIEQARQDPEIGGVVSSWLDHIELHQKYIEMGAKPERPKYPDFWRKVVRVGRVIVLDEAPFVPAGKVPLVPIYCYKDDESIYGFGEVKNVLDQQKIVNEMDYAYVSSVRLVGNPIRVMDKDCGVDPNSITNRPGKIYTPKNGYRFSVEVPPMVGQDYQSVKLSKKESMKDTMGVTDAAMGKSPGSNASGKMVRLLQEQANARIRLKSRILESYSMVRLGEIVTAYIVEYAIARQIRTVDEEGNYIYVDYEPGRVKNLKYDVITVPGSSSGPDKETMQLELSQALANQAITFEDYIRATNPRWKNMVLRGIKTRQNNEAIVQQLQEENLILKAKVDMRSLSPDEIKALEAIQQREMSKQVASLDGQNIQGGA